MERIIIGNLMDNLMINIATDFSKVPGKRYLNEENNGEKNSGERFLNSILEPKFLEAEKNNVKLVVNVDDLLTRPSSFYDGSFGELSRKYKSDRVLKTLIITSTENSNIREIIDEYITNANREYLN